MATHAWDAAAESWLKPYIAAKWKITAFKLTKPPVEEVATSLITQAIRMSFPTDHPFFPYSEPGDKEKAPLASPEGRMLNVAVLSNKRMSGTLADGNKWPGELQFAGSMGRTYHPSQLYTFAKLAIPQDLSQLPQVLTYFRDISNPRPGTADFDFSSNLDQSPFRKIEIDHSLPQEHRLDWSHPLADLTALLLFLFVAAPAGYLIVFLIRNPPGKPASSYKY